MKLDEVHDQFTLLKKNKDLIDFKYAEKLKEEREVDAKARRFKNILGKTSNISDYSPAKFGLEPPNTPVKVGDTPTESGYIQSPSSSPHSMLVNTDQKNLGQSALVLVTPTKSNKTTAAGSFPNICNEEPTTQHNVGANSVAGTPHSNVNKTLTTVDKKWLMLICLAMKMMNISKHF